jgi:polysaccharide export outer membrane protein
MHRYQTPAHVAGWALLAECLIVALSALLGAGRPAVRPSEPISIGPLDSSIASASLSFRRFPQTESMAAPPQERRTGVLRCAVLPCATTAEAVTREGESGVQPLIQLCQALGPAGPGPSSPAAVTPPSVLVNGRAPSSRPGSAALGNNGGETARWLDWQNYAQGEYVAHARTVHVPQYRLRVDDQLQLIYRLTREETPEPYRLNVGDEVRVDSFTDPSLNRDSLVQPDGTITLRLIGQIHATGKTVEQLRQELDTRYSKLYKLPAITVSPLKVNTKLEDLRAVIDRRNGFGGQQQDVRVTPEGTIALPAIGSVPAQGLTLPELQQEINERYRQEIEGIEVVPVLSARAPRYIYVLGEVRTPGRFELVGPTTLMQAISLGGGWNVGANLRQVVVFRRGDDWRLTATVVGIQAALYGHQLCPPGEIWLADSDVVVVPKGPILVANDFINQVFTRGIYGVFPMSTVLNFSKLSTL